MSLLTDVYGHVGHHILHEEYKIGGEIMLWNMIQSKKNYFYIYFCTRSTWKSTHKNHGREDSSLNLSQKIRCGYFYSTNQIGIKVNKALG